jgi:hypothetical protein
MKAFTTEAVGVGGMASGEGDGIWFQLSPDSPTLYALIEARGAYSPAAQETFTVALEGER